MNTFLNTAFDTYYRSLDSAVVLFHNFQSMEFNFVLAKSIVHIYHRYPLLKKLFLYLICVLNEVESFDYIPNNNNNYNINLTFDDVLKTINNLMVE